MEFDLSNLATEGGQNAGAPTEEREEAERLINRERLTARHAEGKTGTGGASVRSDVSGISSMASGARSTASEHIKTSYVANKVETAKLKGDNECLRAQLREMEERLRRLGQPTQEENAPDSSRPRVKVIDVDEDSQAGDGSYSSEESEESSQSLSYDDDGSSRSGSESPSGDQSQGPPSKK
jgi:hypothetical protein